MIDPATIVHRLDEMRAESAAGEEALRELDSQRSRLVAGLVRLGGAVQALEELLEVHAQNERTPVP
jgi:hypothetical protein